MNNAVPMLAALLAATAAAVRAPRWRNPVSRPLTLGLALLAVWALLRAPAINRWGDDLTTSATQLERLPGLIADVSLVAAGVLLAIAVAQAWGRSGLIRAAYTALVAVEVVLLATYDPFDAPEWVLTAQKWVIAAAVTLGSAAIFAAACITYRALPSRLRLPMAVFMLGGLLGVIVGIIRGVVLLLPDVHLGDSWAVLGSLPVYAFAIGSLIAAARTRNATSTEK
ncbi:hypothetical protein [Nocardia sp. NBC_01327]|uniref:hypothetical protein n=1 Tax=Nocardia sp. NBC_01327 TaxID=2903593 RepID=UPI002E1425E4|nr:hypothetical protein OG326_35025 [Nocardia sp. NBC_01327]